MRKFLRVREDSLQETRSNEDSVSTFDTSITAYMAAVHFSMDCRDKIAHKVKHLLEPKLQHVVYTEKQEAIVDFIAGWLLSQLYHIQGGGLHVCGQVNHDHYEEEIPASLRRELEEREKIQGKLNCPSKRFLKYILEMDRVVRSKLRPYT